MGAKDARDNRRRHRNQRMTITELLLGLALAGIAIYGIERHYFHDNDDDPRE